ncbi:MAG: DUF4115 domain-containing protein [Candidatus Methylomirabilis sp.]|nr:DUF4115 domain-containing protein [Deltaproteobacteria bacterium]
MESPGEYLKRERELRGVSLTKIFEATRVPMKFLEAIEADRTEGLPHKAFVKGFIRSYCKVLGLDENDAVLRYEVYLKEREAETASDERRAVPGPSKPNKKEQAAPLRLLKGLRKYAFIAAAVLIIAAAYAVSLKKDSSVEVEGQGSGISEVEDAAAPTSLSPVPPISPAVPESPAVSPEKTAPEAAPPAVVAPSPAKVQPEKAIEKDVQKQAASVTNAQEAPKAIHTLTARASEMVWIKIGVDGGAPVEVLLREGERFTWKGAEGFSVVVGNAGGVTLTYNGRELPALGAQGEVIMLRLPAEDQEKMKAPEKAT